MDEKETDEEDEKLWTIFFHPFHLLFDPSAIPRPAQGRKQLKIVWFRGVEREQTLGRQVKALWSSTCQELFCTDISEIKINCSAPTSLRPSPVTALLAQMCQGLSINLSRPRVCDTFTLDIASLHNSQSSFSQAFFIIHLLSILLAKKRIGSRLAWMSGCCK